MPSSNKRPAAEPADDSGRAAKKTSIQLPISGFFQPGPAPPPSVGPPPPPTVAEPLRSIRALPPVPGHGVPAGFALGSPTKTLGDLLRVTPERAWRSLLGLAQGLLARGPAPAVRPSTTNTLGCWLAQGRGQANGGHTQMVPLKPRATTRAANGAGAVALKETPQGTHRLAVRAWGTEEEQRRMFLGQDVSHLCHQPRCYNPAHLVVESHGDNMIRRSVCQTSGVCGCGLVPACLI